MAICVQGLDYAVLCAFLPLRDEATALKYGKKVSMNHLYLSLMGFGKLQFLLRSYSVHLSCEHGEDCPASTAKFKR